MAQRIADPSNVPDQPLRVLPRGLALVQDYRALIEAQTNRFIGWKWDGSLGPEFVDSTGRKTNHGGRVKQVDEVVTIAADDPHRSEYMRHLRDGDLWPADEATARAAGIAFEVHFMGEHPGVAAAASKPVTSSYDKTYAEPSPIETEPKP
jgi:hypothetical protein